VSALVARSAKRRTAGTQTARCRPLGRRRKLTKYQAQAIYDGRTKGLVPGNYVVLDKIGRAGMGQVSKVEHRRIKRGAALKTLRPSVKIRVSALRPRHVKIRVSAVPVRQFFTATVPARP